MILGHRKKDLTAELTVRTHSILSGLVEKLGGHDEGMNPHEILEAALAACTILTAQMYANRRGLKLESTEAIVKIETEGEKSSISRSVKFSGELTEEEKAKLLEIVGKCPIHKLLESEITVSTNLL